MLPDNTAKHRNYFLEFKFFNVHLVINEKFNRPNYLCIHRIKYCLLSTY